MHKLDRTAVTAPSCLTHYQHPTHTWEKLGNACKQQLRAALVQMQGIPGITTPDSNEYGLRCAYCEGQIRHEGHIEHFRRKNLTLGFPHLTFVWDNLFLACGSKLHCGHYKDRKEADPYDPNELIKPDQDDPEQYLYFHSSGEVRPRAKINAEAMNRAKETIRVFGLNCLALKGKRHGVVNGLKKKIFADLQEVASWNSDEREEYLQQEIAATRWQPYAATIKQFLLDNT